MFLIPPDSIHLKSYVEFCNEFKKNALEPFSNSSVPSSQFWLIHAGEVVGVGNIRHCLTPALEFFGGHIVYGVKVGRWSKGLGTILLSELLKQAQTFEIKTALLTCTDTNTASQRVIEKNDGIWLDTVIYETNDKKKLGRRYMIDTGLALNTVAQKTTLYHSMIYQTEGDQRLMLVPCKALAKGDHVVSYYFDILSTGNNIGRIVFRTADNEEWLYYEGNIGYFINPGHRGKGYAEAACRLMGAKLKRLGILRAVITCDMNNAPSRRVCQNLGAKFLEIAMKIEQNVENIKCRYIWEI